MPPNHEWRHEFGIMPICKIGKDEPNDSIALAEALPEVHIPRLNHFLSSFPSTAQHLVDTEWLNK